MDYKESFDIYKTKENVQQKEPVNVKKEKVEEQIKFSNIIKPQNNYSSEKQPIDDNLYKISQQAANHFLPETLNPELKEAARIGIGYIVYEALNKK